MAKRTQQIPPQSMIRSKTLSTKYLSICFENERLHKKTVEKKQVKTAIQVLKRQETVNISQAILHESF